jgi:glutathione synthase
MLVQCRRSFDPDPVRAFAQVKDRCHVEPKSDKLWIDGKKEVSVVYFRAGYTPVDYKTDAEWAARALLERCSAIKCPSLGYQLAGTKKVCGRWTDQAAGTSFPHCHLALWIQVQQALAGGQVLERFLSPTEAKTLRKLFTRLYPLGIEKVKAKLIYTWGRQVMVTMP